MNTKILKKIGLTDSEIKVYLALLELGSSKKAPIVKKSKISSSKIYEVMDKLIDKGLASYVIKNKVKHFNAAPPSRIKSYIKKKQRTLKQQEKEFNKILPSLNLKQQLTQKGSDAEIYKGWKGMTTVYNDLLESLRKGDHYYVFGQYFNKGGWHTPDIIKTDVDGIVMDKLKIRYTDADGFKVFNEIEYDGEVYYLEEDSTGKSSSFYVMEGDDV